MPVLIPVFRDGSRNRYPTIIEYPEFKRIGIGLMQAVLVIALGDELVAVPPASGENLLR